MVLTLIPVAGTAVIAGISASVAGILTSGDGYGVRVVRPRHASGGLFVYMIYFGWQPYLVISRVRRGLTVASFRMLDGGDLRGGPGDRGAVLLTGFYSYIGYAPLKVGGFPQYWLVINDGGPLLSALAVLRLRDKLVVARSLLTPLIHRRRLQHGRRLAGLFALNYRAPDPPHAFVWAGCLATLILGIMLIDQIGKALVAKSPAGTLATVPSGQLSVGGLSLSNGGSGVGLSRRA